MNLSVFNYVYRKRYYLKHPLKFVNETCTNLRAAWSRATKGYCCTDVWNIADWMLEILPRMLRHLADNAVGYPGDDKYDTPEKWSAHLNSIANLLENAQEDVRDKKNEYAAEYFKELENKDYFYTTDEHGNKVHRVELSEIAKKYLERDRQLSTEQDVMIEEAFKLLAETPLKALWD